MPRDEARVIEHGVTSNLTLGPALSGRVARLTRRLFGLSTAILAAGCSPTALLNGLAPDRLAATDIPYANHPRGTLDVYAPPRAASAPTLVFFYGGNWDKGSKAMYRFVGGALAARGVVTVIPDYRLYPDIRYPTFLRDCAGAVRWTRSNIGRHGGDPRRLFLMGHSAGAYNAAMLALDPGWLGSEGLHPQADLRGAIGLSGPYDFLPLHDKELEILFGGPNDPLTQPIHYVDGHNPPMLLLTGSTDTTVLPRNTHRLAARIRERGGQVEQRTYPGIGHAETVGAIAAPLRFLAPTLRDSLAFMGVETT